jgi:hypothetical protein
MAKRESTPQKQKRILVLCVDRDGDLETKAAVKTRFSAAPPTLTAQLLWH